MKLGHGACEARAIPRRNHPGAIPHSLRHSKPPGANLRSDLVSGGGNGNHRWSESFPRYPHPKPTAFHRGPQSRSFHSRKCVGRETVTDRIGDRWGCDSRASPQELPLQQRPFLPEESGVASRDPLGGTSSSVGDGIRRVRSKSSSQPPSYRSLPIESVQNGIARPATIYRVQARRSEAHPGRAESPVEPCARGDPTTSARGCADGSAGASPYRMWVVREWSLVIFHSSFCLLPSAFCLSPEPPVEPCACGDPTTSARGCVDGSVGASPYRVIQF